MTRTLAEIQADAQSTYNGMIDDIHQTLMTAHFQFEELASEMRRAGLEDEAADMMRDYIGLNLPFSDKTDFQKIFAVTSESVKETTRRQIKACQRKVA